MTNEELVALIQAGDHVQENMAQLWTQNRNFIIKIALPFSKICELEDLIQEGYFGLEKAVQRFDKALGNTFLTYAECWIRQAIQRYCQNNGHLKRLPVHMIEQISKYMKFQSDFQAVTQGEEPTDRDYCFHLGITLDQLKKLRKCMVGNDPISIDAPVPGADNLTIGDSLPSDFDLEGAVVDAVGAEQEKAIIWDAVSSLGGEKFDVITGYYKDGESTEALSSRLAVSRERVRQIKQQAIRTLRRNRQLKSIAGTYGYGCSQAYHWGVGRFKATGSSSTEFLALKHIGLEKKQDQTIQEAHDFATTVPPMANRMREKYHTTPVGIRKLERLAAEMEQLLQELKAINKNELVTKSP